MTDKAVYKLIRRVVDGYTTYRITKETPFSSYLVHELADFDEAVSMYQALKRSHKEGDETVLQQFEVPYP